MNPTRLSLLAVAAAAGLLKPTQVLADWNPAAFNATQAINAVFALGASDASPSADIQVIAADIAEDGASVPVETRTTLAHIESIALLGEKNARPLVALFHLTDFGGVLGTRIKLGTSARIRVIVTAGGKHYTAAKEAKVTLGGCG